MFKKIINLLAVVITLSTFTSCATIMHGTYQSVGVASHPSNACISVDRNYVGNTPLIVNMTRCDNHVIRIELDGYQSYEIILSKQLSGWVFGNIVFGGVIGLAVDAISGAIYKLTPEQVQADLYSNCMTTCKKTSDSYIAIVMEPNPSWEKIGQLVASN